MEAVNPFVVEIIIRHQEKAFVGDLWGTGLFSWVVSGFPDSFAPSGEGPVRGPAGLQKGTGDPLMALQRKGGDPGPGASRGDSKFPRWDDAPTRPSEVCALGWH